MMKKNEIFEDLFVLEMASNHQGNVERGLQIISAFSKVVRFNNVRAAIKLQFRDIDNFVHKDFVGRDDIRYVKRLAETKMSKQDLMKKVWIFVWSLICQLSRLPVLIIMIGHC